MEQKTNVIDRLNHAFSYIAVWSLKNRWIVLFLSLLLLFVSGYFAQHVRMNNSFDAYFDSHDPVYKAYLQYRKDFGSDEVAYLLYDADNYEHGVFDLSLMEKINTLSQRIEEEVPFVKEVNSIPNAEVLIPVEDGIEIIKLEDDFPESQDAMLDFAEGFMKKQIYIDGYVSGNRQYGAIQIDMLKSSVDPLEEIRFEPEGGDGLENLYPQASDSALSKLLAEEQFSDIKFYASGDVQLNAVFNRIAYQDMEQTMTLAFVVVAILLLFFFKGSVIGVIGPMAIVILSVVVTLGFMGVLGWDMDLMFSMVPTLLIAIGVAQAVHIISEFRIAYADCLDRQQAIRRTLELVGAPCLLTSLTTGAGFLAMSISPIKTISHMAVYTGISVIGAFFLSITLLSFFLSFGKNKSEQKIVMKNNNPVLEKLLLTVAHFTIRFPKQIIIVTLALCIFAAVGVNKVIVDSNFLMDFNEKEPIRIATEHIDNTMGGTGSLVYLFNTAEADGIKNPEVLREMDRVQRELNSKTPLVKKTFSIVDLIKDINQSFHDGDPAYYSIPESKDLIAQYLLVYELSGGEELHNFVSSDYSRANIEARIRMASSSHMAQLKHEMENYLQENPLQHSKVEATGIASLWIKLMDYITESQLKGMTLAFAVIALMMCFIFRSVKVGLISMIPNLAPVLFTLGLIGWMGVNLDYSKLLIAPIALGIAVDDTIHLLTRYHNEFKKHRNYEKALIEAISNVGRALFITSVVLVAAFSTFMLATLESQIWFGILLTLTIILALVADFLVMPALILVLKPFGKEAP